MSWLWHVPAFTSAFCPLTSAFPLPPQTHPAKASAADFSAARAQPPPDDRQPTKATRNRQPQPASRAHLADQYFAPAPASLIPGTAGPATKNRGTAAEVRSLLVPRHQPGT